MAKILIVGGAGYVGGTTCAWLMDSGHDVWILDNLSTGHSELLLNQQFMYGDAGDEKLLSEVFKSHHFDCIMHFAAKNIVSESVLKPTEYRENNVTQTIQLVESALQYGIRNFIFSSSCAIFGDPDVDQIHENLPKNPLSPYGKNKLEVEIYLEKAAQTQRLRAIALRYFNAAGADPKLRVGEWHEPETHLIPKIFNAAQEGTPVEIYGADYPTKDGTCIRDYIHVWDLARVHSESMRYLLEAKHSDPGPEGPGASMSGRGLHPAPPSAGVPPRPEGRGFPLLDDGFFKAWNIGSENGYSVREVIQACEKVTGKTLQKIEKPRRSGDAKKLVADSSLILKELGVKAEYRLESIVSSAWNWEKKKKTIQRKAIFLDRDGTLNLDPGYLSQATQMQLLPKVGEALLNLKKAGFLLVVISNQSGVGRGLIELEEIPRIHEKLDQLLAKWKVKIHLYKLCFHHPDENCDCRKPKPRLFQEAASELQIDLSQSYMIGDNVTDLQAGNNAGCKASVLVRTGKGLETEKNLKPGLARFTGDSILEASHWILDQESS